MTLGEYLLEGWLPAVESTVWPATYDGYWRHLRRYVVPAVGALPLQSVQPDAPSVLYRDLLDHGGAKGQPLAPATVRRIHATVHRALWDAFAWGYLLRNLASVAVKPKQRGVGSVEMRTWSAAELRAFLEHVQGDRLYAAWRLAASTGVRRGELLFDAPKTARSRRSVGLDTETVTALRAWRTAQLEERLAWGGAWQETGMLFNREDGSLIHPDAFSAWWSRHPRQSGLPRIRVHDLRHTHASLALQAGVPAKVVSERLGHATVAFTLDVYRHTIPSLHQTPPRRSPPCLCRGNRRPRRRMRERAARRWGHRPSHGPRAGSNFAAYRPQRRTLPMATSASGVKAVLDHFHSWC